MRPLQIKERKNVAIAGTVFIDKKDELMSKNCVSFKGCKILAVEDHPKREGFKNIVWMDNYNTIRIHPTKIDGYLPIPGERRTVIIYIQPNTKAEYFSSKGK